MISWRPKDKDSKREKAVIKNLKYMKGYSLKLEEKLKEAKHPPSTGQPSVLRPFQACLIACMILMFLPIIFAGYASSRENILSLPIDSSQFTNFYSKDDYTFDFYLQPEYKKMAIRFNSQEASVLRQGLEDYLPKTIEIAGCQPRVKYSKEGNLP